MAQTCHSCEVPKGPNAGIHQIYNFYSHAVKWIPELQALRPFVRDDEGGLFKTNLSISLYRTQVKIGF